jgi:MerR HTH family regulatory protein
VTEQASSAARWENDGFSPALSDVSTPARLSRPDAARYLGLSIGTLRNYDREGKFKAERDERGQWWYSLAALDRFVSVNQLLCSRGERPLLTSDGS